MTERMDRIGEWKKFSELVLEHIQEYTIPQYGNAPDDQVGAWTARDCIQSMLRYINRYGRNARGNEEQLRDLLKLAHYACLAHFRYLEGKK